VAALHVGPGINLSPRNALQALHIPGTPSPGG